MFEFFAGEDVPEGGLEEASGVDELVLDLASNFSAHFRQITAKSKFSVGFNVLFNSNSLATKLSNEIEGYVKSD